MRRLALPLITLTVLGITATADLRDEPWLVACGYNLRNIGTALEMYASDHQGMHPKSLGQLVPVYLKKLPTCFAAKRDTYSDSYRRRGPKAYFFCGQGAFHKGAGLATNQPTYDNDKGLGPPGLSQRMAKHKSNVPMPPHLQCKVNIVAVAKALQAYSEKHGDKFPQRLGVLVPRYMKSMPRCLGQDTYSQSYQVTVQGDTYTLYCKGYNHAIEGYPQDRPRFNPDRGLDE